MKIYIASSWRNQLAVELLTMELRRKGHIEQALDDELVFDNPDWIWSDMGQNKFMFDLDGATKSDLVIYIGPGGKDAMAEVGAAYASNVPIIGFMAKGEGQGLMQGLMHKWCETAADLLGMVDDWAGTIRREKEDGK